VTGQDGAAGDAAAAGALIVVVPDPPWLLAPLFLRDFLRLQRVGPGPGLLVDHFPAKPSDVSGLMRAVQADRLVQLTAAAADWPIWWTEAVDHRPGTTEPSQAELLAFSPALSELWAEIDVWFQRWLAKRPAPADSACPEEDILAILTDRWGRLPAPRRLTVLTIPVVGDLFIRPEDDRIVVTRGLRGNPQRYRTLLEPVLADFF